MAAGDVPLLYTSQVQAPSAYSKQYRELAICLRLGVQKFSVTFPQPTFAFEWIREVDRALEPSLGLHLQQPEDAPSAWPGLARESALFCIPSAAGSFWGELQEAALSLYLEI